MASQHTDRRALIASLAQAHALRPDRYRLRLRALALLGTAYPTLLGMLSACGFGLALLWADGLWSSLAAGVSVLALALLLPLFKIPLEDLEGRRLTALEAPKLYALIDKIRRKIGAPPIDEVVIDDDFTLHILQRPRLGVLGRPRTVLRVGLPLLQLLSRKEFAALLTHEYEPLCRVQGRVDAWLARQRKRWVQMLDQSVLPARADVRFAWTPVAHFIRYFEAYSFVQARESVYRADRLGSRVVGKRLMADALISQALGQHFLDDQFWTHLWAQAAQTERPSFLPHAQMRTALIAGSSASESAAWLQTALTSTPEQPSLPSLRERLQMLDESAEIPPRSALSAAQSLLNEALPALVKHFDTRWMSRHLGEWEARHHALVSARETVGLYRGRPLAELPTQDQFRYGLALRDLGETDQALTTLQLAANNPKGSAQAAMAVAQMLHEAADEATIHYLELAMSRDAQFIEDATEQAARFYQERGNHELARRYRQRLNPARAA